MFQCVLTVLFKMILNYKATKMFIGLYLQISPVHNTANNSTDNFFTKHNTVNSKKAIHKELTSNHHHEW